jgi:hypothetical protein
VTAGESSDSPAATTRTARSSSSGSVASPTGLALALLAAVVLFVAVTLVLDLTLSLIVATAEHQPRTLPGGVAMLHGVGATLLIAALWTVAGVFIGLLARGQRCRSALAWSGRWRWKICCGASPGCWTG